MSEQAIERNLASQSVSDARRDNNRDLKAGLKGDSRGLDERACFHQKTKDVEQKVDLHWDLEEETAPPHQETETPSTHSQRKEDLRVDHSVLLYREALDMHPPSHPGRPFALNNLSDALAMRFKRKGDIEDLEEAIKLDQEALKLRPPTDPNRPDALTHLSDSLTKRFKWNGDFQDLEEIINLKREVLDLRPQSHSDRHLALASLASALTQRFERNDDIQDLDEVISLEREVLHVRPPSHPYRYHALANLAWDLSRRFKRKGQMQDLEERISLGREVLHLRPPSHPDRHLTLADMAWTLSRRFERNENMQDLEEAISLEREVLHLRSPSHPDRSHALSNLAWSLSRLFEQNGDMQVLKEMVSLVREALKLQPATHPYGPETLSHRFSTLFWCFELKFEILDLEKTIRIYRKALELQPAAHPDRPDTLTYISVMLFILFEQKGDIQNLDEAISMSQQGLDLLPTPHFNRVQALEHLASALSVRLKQNGNIQDLDKIINLNREAIDLQPWSEEPDSFKMALRPLEEFISDNLESLEVQPPPHPDCFKALKSLAIAFYIRFDHIGNYQDLEESISFHREALHLRPLPHPDRFEVLNSLAAALFTRSRKEEHFQDLEESIHLFREALLCLPPYHPSRSATLESLATALFARFEQKGVSENLEESILLHREALDLRTPLHPNRVEVLNSLASALSTRFERKGSLEDLEESINLYREALILTPFPHLDRSVSLCNLAKTLSTRFESTGAPEDSAESVALYQEARHLPELLLSDHSKRFNDLASLISTGLMHAGTSFLQGESETRVSKSVHQKAHDESGAQYMHNDSRNAPAIEQIRNTKATESFESISILTGEKSELICALEVADFLQRERDAIRYALNQKLSDLGYSGDYILQAAFNEALLRQGIEHPEVFLILNGDLKDDDVAISRDLSSIFSPHTTVLYMESRVLNLIPPNELEPPLSYQESPPSPVPIHQLHSSNQSQSIKTIGSSQPSDEQGNQGSTGKPSRDDEDKGKHPDEERDEEKQMDKGKGKAKEDDRLPDPYRRQLQLCLETPLTINDATCKGSKDNSHEFNIEAKIHIKVRSNHGGTDWNELATDVSHHIPQGPLCSVSFDEITASSGGIALHSLAALKVHVEATPSHTKCEQLLPKTDRYKDIKISSERRTKGGGSATLGPKPEAKLELARENAIREESTRPAWTIRRHHIPKVNPQSAHVRAATVEYRLNGSEAVTDEEFRPGPSAIFSYKSDQTNRSLYISVRAFWSSRLDSDKENLKNRIRQIFDKLTGHPPNLNFIYANFFHEFSFSVDLRVLMEGEDNDILRGENVVVDGDNPSDSKFKAMLIDFTRNGEVAQITVPLRRALIAAIGRDGSEEGERKVSSP